MPGAGYDIGLAASQADNYTFGAPYVSDVVFSGARLEGGSALNQQRDSADATATTKSPGTTNIKDTSEGGFSPLDSAFGSNPGSTPSNKNVLIYGLGAAVILYLILK